MTAHRALVVVTTLALGGLTACTGDAEPGTTTRTSPASSASAPSTTSTTNPADQDLRAAEATIGRFWAVVDRLSKDATATLDGLATVSRSPAIGIWRQLLTKQRVDGQVQTGDSTVMSAVAKTTAPKTYAVDACIDVSKVNLVGKNGESVVSANRAPRVEYGYVVEKGTDGKFYVITDKAVGPC